MRASKACKVSKGTSGGFVPRSCSHDSSLSNLKRRFNSIADMDAEHKNVRIWGGIHFRNSLEVGDDMGKKIAAHLIANSLKSVR